MRSMGGAVRGFLALTLLAAVVSAVGAFIARGRMASLGGPEDDELDLVAIYDRLDFTSTAPALRRAAVTAWYGGGTLDLRGATLDPGGAVLTVRAAFGGYRLVIPETWRVELRTKGIFGGVGDGRKSDRIDPNSPGLTIDGFAVFGGIGIVAEAPDLDEPEARVPTPEAVPLRA